MNALEIRGLSKSFGAHKVIDSITFSVPENCVYGFIGANGAGKTTTMKMILGLLKADGGEIDICGERVRFGATKTNRLIGYLPDVPEYYGYMRPKAYLRLCADVVGIDSMTAKTRISKLLELVGLSNADKKIRGFSRGMKQRLGMAQALISEPKLLICDEPTSALDPIGRKEILDILRRIKGETTVVFSTHILSDVARICDRIAVLGKGRIALESAVSDLKLQRKSKAMTLEFDKPVEMEDVLHALREHKLSPTHYETAETSIEDLILEMSK
jgi:ABC-2 type transport system ATP-binding protein